MHRRQLSMVHKLRPVHINATIRVAASSFLKKISFKSVWADLRANLDAGQPRFELMTFVDVDNFKSCQVLSRSWIRGIFWCELVVGRLMCDSKYQPFCYTAGYLIFLTFWTVWRVIEDDVKKSSHISDRSTDASSLSTDKKTKKLNGVNVNCGFLQTGDNRSTIMLIVGLALYWTTYIIKHSVNAGCYISTRNVWINWVLNRGGRECPITSEHSENVVSFAYSDCAVAGNVYTGSLTDVDLDKTIRITIRGRAINDWSLI